MQFGLYVEEIHYNTELHRHVCWSKSSGVNILYAL